MRKLIIFTDLDGTLLNHHTYEYEVVKPLIERLKSAGIPVVLNSSKTLAELETWQQRLGLMPPVIAENGGVILLDDGKQGKKHLIGMPYEDIRSYIKHLRKANQWKFEGFGDWTVAEVMNKTGLKSADAVKAKEREVSEPILWMDSDENLEAFKEGLEKEGLILKRGGRFHHVMAGHDKADAMRYLTSHPPFECETSCKVIALGDGENDLDMLCHADIAVVLPPAKGEALDVENAIYAESEAPLGWVESIEDILQQEGV
ncbi:HAD-IIB family hydrolase [Thiomicrorhabdus sp. ZW0627]|uniref:HAD-IIB family hydrolase n=1 Tax=Thiomicrorhabdus sp. ZW0627 TaxID=3039774 RepID=UPI002436A4B8|nr:HAD-IIB family hydrolase [Thiomicrorhabdus sp. ZW0627]MDG6774726.1 HAD-IIB family hydrolase [Thiomicrorhabdus sp. ZW0627]